MMRGRRLHAEEEGHDAHQSRATDATPAEDSFSSTSRLPSAEGRRAGRASSDTARSPTTVLETGGRSDETIGRSTTRNAKKPRQARLGFFYVSSLRSERRIQKVVLEGVASPTAKHFRFAVGKSLLTEAVYLVATSVASHKR